MVRAGSGAQVAGLGLDVLHQDQISKVVARYLRLGYKQAILAEVAIEAIERPSRWIAFMPQKFGFARPIRGAPMFEQ
jgi:hypothetical protein